MSFRRLCFGKSGIFAITLLLAPLLALGAGVAVKVASEKAESSSRKTRTNLNHSNASTASTDARLLKNDFNNALVQSHHDSTTLADILEQRGLLSLMTRWQGKALFMKLDTTQSPHNFRYYEYDAIYQDSNRNAVQDPADRGFFNPASTVKVVIAALVLETLSERGLTRQANYRVANTQHWYTFEEDIRRALVISDNEATNRLILWLGFDNLNNKLDAKELSGLVINRLMLDKGTLVSSPPFEMRFNGERIQQPEQTVSLDSTCYEIRQKIGNCATAVNLLKSLMQINHPEYFHDGEGFSLSSTDREWLKTTLSRTPREEGFDYADDYCRFLTELENKLASKHGKMLSKCGVSLFTNRYTDLSYLETDDGEKYYILLSLSPPRSISEADIIYQMGQISEAILLSLL